MATGIIKLSSEVQALIQSSTYINSLRRTVEELVYNSLDSHATSIAVRINHTDFSIQVIDNGQGICKEDMDMVGTKFATSKIKDIKDIASILCKYGFRGIALASLVDVSEYLKITSRHSGSEVTWTKEYRKGRFERIYETVSRPSQGTTVEIKGLLYNLEIQRKILNPTREVQEIKNFIERTSILHTGVSFSLRDDVKNDIIVKIPKKKDMCQTIESIYGLNISENIQELQIEKNPYKVKAFLGKKCIEEDLRLIYLNGRYVLNSKLHKLIDVNLSRVFGGNSGANNVKKTSRFTEDIEVNCKSYPFYVLFISCPYNAYDMTQMTGKTLVEFHNWISIDGLLKTLVEVFMEGLETKNVQSMKVSKIDKPESKAQKAKDVRTIQEKVASIVEKILRSDPKKLQAQNEVKGKPAKRRNKNTKAKLGFHSSNTKQSKMNKLKLESIKKTTKAKSVEFNLPEHDKLTQDIEKQESLIPYEQNDSQCNMKRVSIKMKPKKDNIKKITTKTLCVPKRKFTKVFETIDGSVKQRCKDLSTNVAHLMKKYNIKNLKAKHNINVNIIQKDVFKNKVVSVKNITNTKNIHSHKVESIQKRSGKIMVREFISFPQICDRSKFLQKYLQMYCKNNKSNKEVKSRYDLLQTVINTQNSVTEKSVRKIKNNAKRIKEIDNFKINKELSQELPFLTYQSHHYEVKTNKHYIDKSIIHAAERNYIPKESVHRKTESRELLNKPNEDVLPTNSTKTNELEHRVKKYYGIMTNINRKMCPKKTGSIVRHESGVINFVAPNKNYNNSNVRNHLDMTDAMDQVTEYNFDDEVNRQISFTLTSQKIPQIEKHNNYLGEVETTKQDRNLSISQYNLQEAGILGKRKKKETYIIDETEIVAPSKSRAIKESNEKSSIEYISETANSINKTMSDIDISINPNVILFENIHTNIEEEVFSEPIANDSFTFTDFKRYGYRNSDKPIHDNIQVTFKSQSYPCRDDSIDTQPLNMCQAIIESSDIFDTESLHLENSGISNEIQGNNTKLKQSYTTNNTTKVNMFKNPTLSVDRNKICKDTSNTNEEADKIFERKANVVERMDGNGKVCYLNVDNGMTYSSNEITTVNNFDLKKRPNYVPKGLSQIFQNEKLYNKNAAELQSQDYFTKSMYENFAKEVEKGAEVYEPAAQNLAEMTTKETDNAQMRFRKLNASIMFEGTAIRKAKVLRQVDSKFIACMMEGMKYHAGSNNSYLVLFDQHAVDERIRLEQLMSEYKKDSVWETVACDKFSITLSDEEMFYIESFSDKFRDIGLDWISDFNKSWKTEMSVVSVPAAVIGKHKRKMETVHNVVKSIIREHIKTLKDMNGGAGTPKTLTDLVNTEACRFAVKFGDRLRRGACVDMMTKLAGCLAPFQCAHGRPDVAVLLMVKPDERDYKINMDKLKKLTFNL